MSIKVKSLGLVKNEEIEIKAVASLEVDGMKIDGIRVNESENGNLYLQFPDRKFKKKSTDELITTRLMYADNEVFKKISDTLFQAYKDKKEKGEFEAPDIEVEKSGVTVTQANPLKDQSKKTKAMVSLETNGIHLKDIRLNESNEGKLYLQFPNRKTKDEEYKDMFYPTNAELREQLTEQAVSLYQEKLIAKEFDESAKEELFRELNKDYISGLTLTGGDPLFESNLDGVLDLVTEVNRRYNTAQYIDCNTQKNHNILNANADEIRLSSPKKSIWLYTGFYLEEIFEPSFIDQTQEWIEEYLKQCEIRKQILSQCDVLVDGRYVDSQRDITLHYRGSTNQSLIDIQQSLQKGKIVLWQI